ncbi:MAG: hypothetical protein IGR92_08075 [Leptolyngbyaceae cyanobacterium T60_A2020_046]|nr:hypothetical protein [Leptolyngbyaceae cyanobacterium T60_A2020_046]
MSFRQSFRQIQAAIATLGHNALDRVALALSSVLAVAAAALILSGDHAITRVQEFSWEARAVGAENTAFLMTFNRPMNPESVTTNLRITPPLPGKVSWSGRRMVYTLTAPIPYGETFAVSIDQARDRLSDAAEPARFEPFVGQFHSRDRAFAYIGVEGEEAGRLVLVNFSQDGKKTLLTPSDQRVLDFQPYPLGDRILFSAIPTADLTTGNFNPVLYSVATGLAPTPPDDFSRAVLPTSRQPDVAGVLTPILPSDDYQNLAFDLSANGRTIVVQRVSRTDPADFGPWVLTEGEDPIPLETEPGGEFLIAPDSQTLLMLQGQGTAVIPLEAVAGEDQREPLDFLPEYGRVFDVTSNGTTAAMVDFNQNNPERRFTESLMLVTNQGEETELLNVSGSINGAQFDTSNQLLFVLASQVLPGENYVEQASLLAVRLADREIEPLVTFSPQAQVSFSVAPDGLAILISTTNEGAIADATTADPIWLLPLYTTAEERLNARPVALSPEPLPYRGLQPTWLP